MNDESPHLQSEAAIKWLENPKKYPYVREKFELHSFRSRFPLSQYRRSGNFKLLGYSEISLTAHSIYGGFYRRLFYLMSHDPYPKGSPGPAVKPSSIRFAKPSIPGRDDE